MIINYLKTFYLCSINARTRASACFVHKISPVGTGHNVCRTLMLNGFSCRSTVRTTTTIPESTCGGGPTWLPTSCRRNWRSPRSPCYNRNRNSNGKLPPRPLRRRNRCVQSGYGERIWEKIYVKNKFLRRKIYPMKNIWK